MTILIPNNQKIKTRNFSHDILSKKKSILKNARDNIEKFSLSLDLLRKRNLDPNHINRKLYYLLCNPFLFVNAYVKLSKNTGTLTKKMHKEEETMDVFRKINADNIANKFKEKNYNFSSIRRTWIPKPGKSLLRPINTPTQEDRIVQEAIKGILEWIYEPEFSRFEELNNYSCTNFGFRPTKSTCKAILNLKKKGQSTNYGIEGDIIETSNTIDHTILINILKRKIKDRDFLNVIRKLLQSGVMENNKRIHSLNGTPQGGIVSPLLFNIYMFEFDQFVFKDIMQPIIEKNAQLKQIPNKEYDKIVKKVNHLREQRYIFLKELKMSDQNNLSNRKKASELFKEIKKLNNIKFKLPFYEPKSLKNNIIYCRYANNWLILYSGKLTDCINIKERLKNYLDENLKIELDQDKTKITSTTEGIHFLGFTYKMDAPKQTRITHVVVSRKGNKPQRIRRMTFRKTRIYPDKNKILTNLIQKKFCKKDGFPIGNGKLALLTPYEIVMKYQQIMMDLYNYYAEVDNLTILSRVSYILQYSCAKTIARRKKISLPKIFSQYGKNINIRSIKSSTEKKMSYTIQFNTLTDLLNKNTKTKKAIESDKDPFSIKDFGRPRIKM